MTTLKLAIRNLLGAGLRTWLNALVLSLIYVVIIFMQGMYDGMNQWASRVRTEEELGGGQYWHETYDPFDPFALEDAHGPLAAFEGREVAPILIRAGTIYPDGRMQSVLLKGIEPDQTILDLPTAALAESEAALPVLLGSRMAKKHALVVGDEVTVRWRDAAGTFDARDAEVVHIMKTDTLSVDNGLLWVPLDRLQEMTGLEGEATLVVVPRDAEGQPAGGWRFRDHDYLLADLKQMLAMKSRNASFLHGLLLLMACLAIFNSQVLAIFRRMREIGTMIALGMTRGSVIALFTLEGTLNAVLAAGLGAVYGIPLLSLTAVKGIPLPDSTEEWGYSIGAALYPRYSLMLVLATVLLVLLTTAVVSFLPTRRITRLKPTDALRGKR